MAQVCDSAEWQHLLSKQEAMADQRMMDLFAADPERAERFSVKAAGLLLDFSKNWLDHPTLKALTALAEQRDLSAQIRDLFAGRFWNASESRAAWHTQLRAQEPVMIDGRNLTDEATIQRARMIAWAQQLREGHWLGCTGHAIQNIVVLGMGGSIAGPQLLIDALSAQASTGLSCHFIIGLDDVVWQETLSALDPETTLFVVISKSFTTSETLHHAQEAQTWLLEHFGPEADLDQHFVAVTSREEKAEAFGISRSHCLTLWPEVGGRFSLWSVVGFPILLMLGEKAFSGLLAGALAMDQHFQEAPFEKNMPVILALLGIWYHNFFGAQTQAMIAYSPRLRTLLAYLQQQHMESRGKQVTQNGEPLSVSTGPVVWGGLGTESQHSFHQLFHQGRSLLPIDFIAVLKDNQQNQRLQETLLANCLSQSQALLEGRTRAQIGKDLERQGFDPATIERLAPHKVLPGNRPSNTIILAQLDAYHLGALLALYEHKVFAQAVIWDINPFDQWGVEQGKQLAATLLSDLAERRDPSVVDPSTAHLVAHYYSTLAD